MQRATDHINSLYAYPVDGAKVLFKLTLAADDQFREDFEGALSYFVGKNPKHAEDNGFAIAPYTNVRWEPHSITTHGATAMAMGNYYFTKTDGSEVKVEYTFGYMRDADGELRINVHHSSLPFSADETAAAEPITEADVLAAQKTWGEGIVAIGQVYSSGGDYVQRAAKHIDDLYAYSVEGASVLFKPTLAADDQFREDFEGALSYFVGKNPKYQEDKGFAIAPYTHVRWQNTDVALYGNTAKAMGNYWLTKPDGTEVKVEYSFGYVRDENGQLRITLHHSSLPYTPGG